MGESGAILGYFWLGIWGDRWLGFSVFAVMTVVLAVVVG